MFNIRNFFSQLIIELRTGGLFLSLKFKSILKVSEVIFQLFYSWLHNASDNLGFVISVSVINFFDLLFPCLYSYPLSFTES